MDDSTRAVDKREGEKIEKKRNAVLPSSPSKRDTGASARSNSTEHPCSKSVLVTSNFIALASFCSTGTERIEAQRLRLICRGRMRVRGGEGRGERKRRRKRRRRRRRNRVR